MTKFSILITTKNRLNDLKTTLNKLACFIEKNNIECIICDDGSSDGTSKFLRDNYPNIILIQHQKSKGLIASRNELLNLTKATYAITLDDDAHILSQNPFEIIETFFESNKKCAVISFRIFWGKNELRNTVHDLKPHRVKSFVGCGHVWRMEAWKEMPNYPEWFVFYGEEAFASYHLFQKNWQVWFLPNVLIQHRVEVKNRKNNNDYTIRLRRSLRSGWYLYFMFFPISEIPKKLAYTFWMQLKLKVFKGDYKALFAIIGATFNLILNLPKLIFKRKPLTELQYKEFKDLPDTVIYWEPSNEN
ncbi:glycosyltransferase family 2 protein [Yeosuana marina]|uniref:glycosyltransferase family 2 protein n=1 Tax=Yeosuana marina TaxID=1565536 RepID=UPI0014202E4C|nr:glycosyltransferase [Yeosuana marina]